MTPDAVQQMIAEAMQAQQDGNSQDDLTKALIGKFDSLPEDTKKAILNEIGLPAEGLSSKQQELNTKKFDVAANQAGPSDEELAQQDASREQAAEAVAESNAEKAESASEEPENAPEQDVEPLDNLTPELDEDDKMLIAALQERGFTNEQIGQAIAMLKDGATPEDVLNTLIGA
jgi:SOS response regulatory protein OraA/RecX